MADEVEPTWITLTSMSAGRSDFQMEVINGKIYTMGGIDNGVINNSTEVYDPVINQWTTLASMSTSRAMFQTEVINGKIYAMGGTMPLLTKIQQRHMIQLLINGQYWLLYLKIDKDFKQK